MEKQNKIKLIENVHTNCQLSIYRHYNHLISAVFDLDVYEIAKICSLLCSAFGDQNIGKNPIFVCIWTCIQICQMRDFSGWKKPLVAIIFPGNFSKLLEIIRRRCTINWDLERSSRTILISNSRFRWIWWLRQIM